MKRQASIFRIKTDTIEGWSCKKTRSELLKQLNRYVIKKSRDWPYGLKLGKEYKITNFAGKVVFVRKEYGYSEEIDRVYYGYEISYLDLDKSCELIKDKKTAEAVIIQVRGTVY